MTDRQFCFMCNSMREEAYALIVPSLQVLKVKGGEILGFSCNDPVTVVLEADGTIIEGNDYFLSLPMNTKFMLLSAKQSWLPPEMIKKIAAWMALQSMDADTADSFYTEAAWWHLAQQMKQNLTSLLLMSETDLQSLVDAPSTKLSFALDVPKETAEGLQKGLVRMLRRRRNQRILKTMQYLWITSLRRNDYIEPGATRLEVVPLGCTRPKTFSYDTYAMGQSCSESTARNTGDEVDSVSGLTSWTLMVLKRKNWPETRLSYVELQAVVSKGLEKMSKLLDWNFMRTLELLWDCEAQLAWFQEQFQHLPDLKL